MADKSFEQRVQEQLEGLHMKPDASVWQEVEAVLRRERKHRWLIWIFLLVAGCGGASFWAYYQFVQPRQEHEIVIAKPIINTGKSQTLSPSAAITEKNRATDSLQVHATVKGQVADKTEQTGLSYPMPVIKHNKHIVKPSTPALKEPDTKDNNIAIDPKQETSVITPETNKIINNETVTLPTQTITIPAIDTGKGVDKEVVATQIKQPESPVPVADLPGSVIAKNKKSKWRWNIAVDGGISGIRKSLFMQKVTPADVYASSPSTGNISGAAQPGLKIPVSKDALSFGIQLQAIRAIGKKQSIGISLGYSLFQTTTSVGSSVDSTVFFSGYNMYNTNGYYYRSTDSIDYTNQYHFLQTGVDLYRDMKLFKKISTRWQLGTGLNFLISTNALHYDAGTGRLFRNNSLMQKMQVHFSAGFDVAIGKQPFLYVGPHWQYFISDLTKISGSNQHLFLSSLRAAFILPEKKNKMQR